MRRADIKVGEDYAVGTRNSPDYQYRATALEVGVERRVFDGWHTHSRPDGVRIQFQEGYRKGRTEVVAASRVVCSWAEYEADKAQRQEKERSISRARLEVEHRVKRGFDRLARLGYPAAQHVVAVSEGEFVGSLELRVETVEEMLAALEKGAV